MKFSFTFVVAALVLMTTTQGAPFEKRADGIIINITVKYTADGNVTISKYLANTILRFGSDDIATLTIPEGTPANSGNGQLSLKFADLPLQGATDKRAQFQELFKTFTTQAQATFNLHGTSDVVTKAATGEQAFKGLPFATDITLKGINGLTSAPLKIEQAKVVGGTKDGIQIDVSSTLQNPSDIAITLGMFRLMCSIRIRRLAFLGGQTSEIFLVGTSESTPIDSLKPSLSTLKVPATVIGAKNKMIKSSFLVLSLDAILDLNTTGTVSLLNILDTDFTVTHMKVTILYKDSPYGVIDQDTNFIVPHGQERVSDKMAVKIVGSDEHSVEINNDPHTVEVDIESVITIKIGDYIVTIPYKQKNVRLDFDLQNPSKFQEVKSRLLPSRSSKYLSYTAVPHSTQKPTFSIPVKTSILRGKPSITHASPKSTEKPAKTKPPHKGTEIPAESVDKIPESTKR
ncbi:uncharacterized protein VTP21DRAFT_7390 [Calcarisporiella thermophila]|uniref:uncharacterized protein n=1 Tax=Calcarisporiella thermophila TaxID=911321 RepID=UPI003743622E